MLSLINLLAELFPTTSADSTFVFVLLGLMAVLFPATVTYTGIQQAGLISGYDERRGLWLARTATIISILFVVAGIVLTIMLLTTGDTTVRPMF